MDGPQSAPRLSVKNPIHDYDGNYKPYAFKPDGSKNEEIFVNSPFDYSGSVSQYVLFSRHALIKGRLHIFGGVSGYNKVIT